MADVKFGTKRICPHCEKKFYDLNKQSPFTCPCGDKEIVIEEELSFSPTPAPAKPKKEPKDEFAGIENTDNTDNEDEGEDGIISLDEAAVEEEQDSKN